MQFVPLWDSILDNLKLHRIGPEMVGKWAFLLVAAQRYDCYEGTLPDLETLAFWLRLPPEEVQRWLDELTAAKMLDRKGKSYAVHDWSQWRCVKDKTSRERVRRHREKAKKEVVTGPPNPPRNGDVTTVKRERNGVEASNDQRSFASAHSKQPASERAVRVSEELEPFDPGPETIPLSPTLPPDKLAVLARQTQRWGASNGDRVVGDLLVDYSAATVSAACDHHYRDNNGVLDPKRLGGICREMHAGRWKVSTQAKGEMPRPAAPIYGAIQGP